MLEKHLLNSERIEKFNSLKDQKVEKSVKFSHKCMVEKEKFNEIMAFVSKSSNNKETKKKLIEYSILDANN